MVPFVTVYTLCLFLPAIDMLATYTFKLFSFSFTFGLAALIFPAIYPLSDSITEVYGKKVAWYLIMASYMPAVIISILNNIMLALADNHLLYDFLLKPSLLITIMGPIAYVITSWINVKLISQLKMKMRGKHFSIRSFVCSGLSETLTSLIVLPVVFYNQGLKYTSHLYIGSVLTKMLITIPFVFIARMLVNIYRQVDGHAYPIYNQSLMNLDNMHPPA